MMTLEDCLAAAKSAQQPFSCIVDNHDTVGSLVPYFSLASCTAIGLATIIAFFQIRAAKNQHLAQVQKDRNIADSHIASAEKITRLRATLDLLIQLQSNSHWGERRANFIALRDTEEGLEKYAGKSADESTIVRAQLNQYELIAIGIKLSILDVDMYKHYYRTTFVNDFKRARNFIDKERKGPNGSSRYWEELEALAHVFDKEASGAITPAVAGRQ